MTPPNSHKWQNGLAVQEQVQNQKTKLIGASGEIYGFCQHSANV
jgi:hypothetical protein